MIIGIGGCSNSGKSALAEKIDNFFNVRKVKVLCQDDFVKRRDFLTEINGHIDWELPSTIKFDEYLNAVKKAAEKNDLVICEGLFAFWFDELNELYNKKIFLKLDKKTFFERKQKDLRWGKEPDWYIEHIRQSYLKYGQLNLPKENTLFIDASKNIDFDEVINFIGLKL
ncbi:MAG: AAA family ATPase [Bacteroidales bacterium]|nr:AAA family ATPase [Bacteroidales bacterium]